MMNRSPLLLVTLLLASAFLLAGCTFARPSSGSIFGNPDFGQSQTAASPVPGSATFIPYSPETPTPNPALPTATTRPAPTICGQRDTPCCSGGGCAIGLFCFNGACVIPGGGGGGSGTTPTPVSTPTPACTSGVYGQCFDDYRYLTYSCVDGTLKPVTYFVDPCMNHADNCTQDYYQTCADGKTQYKQYACNNETGKLSLVTYFKDPCAAVGCTQDQYMECPDGYRYLSGVCNTSTGQLTLLKTMNPCPSHPYPCTQDFYATCSDGKTQYKQYACNPDTGKISLIEYFHNPCSPP